MDEFGCREDPFALVPDPRFYFHSRAGSAALEALRIGVAARCGPLLLTGENGVGKTLILRQLQREMHPSTSGASPGESGEGAAGEAAKDAPHRFVYANNPHLTIDDLRARTADALGLTWSPNTGAPDARAVNTCLHNLTKEGGLAVLALDEAGLFPEEVLAALPELSRDDPAGAGTLLQIVLAGGSELEERLASDPLSRLNGRIADRIELGRLDSDEVGPFIAHRLSVAGRSQANLFTPEAIERVASYAEGLPNEVIRLCENALRAASVREQTVIDLEIVERAAGRMRAWNTTASEQDEPWEAPTKEPRQESRQEPRQAVSNPAFEPEASHGHEIPIPTANDGELTLAALLRTPNPPGGAAPPDAWTTGAAGIEPLHSADSDALPATSTERASGAKPTSFATGGSASMAATLGSRSMTPGATEPFPPSGSHEAIGDQPKEDASLERQAETRTQIAIDEQPTEDASRTRQAATRTQIATAEAARLARAFGARRFARDVFREAQTSESAAQAEMERGRYEAATTAFVVARQLYAEAFSRALRRAAIPLAMVVVAAGVIGLGLPDRLRVPALIVVGLIGLIAGMPSRSDGPGPASEAPPDAAAGSRPSQAPEKPGSAGPD